MWMWGLFRWRCDSLPLKIPEQAWPCNRIVYFLSQIVWTLRSSVFEKHDVYWFVAIFFQFENQKWRPVGRTGYFLNWCMTQTTEPCRTTMSKVNIISYIIYYKWILSGIILIGQQKNEKQQLDKNIPNTRSNFLPLFFYHVTIKCPTAETSLGRDQNSFLWSHDNN